MYKNGILYSWFKYKELKCRVKNFSVLRVFIEYLIKNLSVFINIKECILEIQLRKRK